MSVYVTPVIVVLPTTCNLALGLVVPIPTLPEVSTNILTLAASASYKANLPAPKLFPEPEEYRVQLRPPVDVLSNSIVVPPVALDTISKGALGLVVPIPTLPELVL